MKYELTRPCAKCPFRTDSLKGWLGEGRATEIIEAITTYQATFACHETTEFDEGESVPIKDEQHCAGAMILLEKLEQPNQMMRICERIGMYDRRKLDMEAPVFDEPEAFVEHHTEQKPRRKKASRE